MTRTKPTFLPCSRIRRTATRGRHRQRSHPDEDDFGILGHIFLEERAGVAAAKDFLEFVIGLINHAHGAAHGVVGLAANFHQPVLVDLGGDGDRVVGVQLQFVAAVARAGSG